MYLRVTETLHERRARIPTFGKAYCGASVGWTRTVGERLPEVLFEIA